MPKSPRMPQKSSNLKLGMTKIRSLGKEAKNSIDGSLTNTKTDKSIKKKSLKQESIESDYFTNTPKQIKRLKTSEANIIISKGQNVLKNSMKK
jgi:hypothetical protein